MLWRSRTQSPEVDPKHPIAAAFPSPWSWEIIPLTRRVPLGISGVRCVGGQAVFFWGASGLGSLGGGVPTRLAQNRFVFHPEGLLPFSVGVLQAKGVGSGVPAGGRAAHLFVALLVGVVTRVSRLLAAFAAVGALRGKDLLGWRRHSSWSEVLFIPQDGSAVFIQAGSTLILKTPMKLGLKKIRRDGRSRSRKCRMLTWLPGGFTMSLLKRSQLLLWFLLLTGPALLDPPWNRRKGEKHASIWLNWLQATIGLTLVSMKWELIMGIRASMVSGRRSVGRDRPARRPSAAPTAKTLWPADFLHKKGFNRCQRTVGLMLETDHNWCGHSRHLGLPLLMRIKAHMTIQAKAMHTPTMIPVMDRWSMWYRPSEKTGR